MAAAVNQNTRGTPPQRSVRTITLGDEIIHNERIETDTDGLLQVLLADGTTFTVGPGSELTIDSFVYDPDANTASISASLGRGVFRFIGGVTSKTPDGVNLETPVGTVGIRGAIVDMVFEPAGDDMPSHIDLRFGEGLTLWQPGGTPARLYKAGYSIVIENSGTVRIVRTPPNWTGFFQALISGRGGEGGGAPLPPTDDMVAASKVPANNSELPLQLDFVPIPTPRPERNRVVDDGGRDVIRRVVENLMDDNEGEEPPPPPPPPSEQVSLRVLTSPSGAAGDGIVGGSADSDQTLVLTVEEGAGEGTGSLAQGAITLPVYDSASFTSHAVGPISSPFGTLSGRAYSGPYGFAAYLLAIDGDPSNPFYAITGTPTDLTANFAGGGVRHYSLTPDPIQGVGVPFVTNHPNLDFSTATISDFLLVEPTAGGDGSGRVLQTWIMLDGAGASQKSAIGVNVGALAGDGSGFTLDRRGSYRVFSNERSYQYFGTAAALAGSAGTAIFGRNGENFVVSDSQADAGHFYDSAADAYLAGQDFSTIHVGNLENRVASPGRSLTGTYQGFAAGLVETVYDAGDGVTVSDRILGRSAGPQDMTIAFDTASKSIGGSITISMPLGYQDVGAPEGLTVAFGDGIDGNTQNGDSAYVDDDTFAATANSDPTRTRVQRSSADDVYQRQDQEAGTYIVSGNNTDLAKMGVSSDHLCSSCDFLEWGWWGTQVETVSGDPPTESGRFSVHMGTWVAGDLAQAADLENLESSNAGATYKGMAVGNVMSGGNAYVAAGDMTLNYSFGDRSGNLSIDDFDGRSFSGEVYGSPYTATFEGSLSGMEPFVYGSANGAFVNNGSDVAAGVIGSFDAFESGSDWQANGVFAGERTSLGTPQ
ncbi:FecR family protein [Nitratireductor sp. GCM10026969]|uniref:FecR family protein n=1 Tax=Nitratireductor sp. GCM10026969 TaxID=3252645 RepID=UPI0036199CD4